MRIIIAGLVLALAVFLNSIELSSQSGTPRPSWSRQLTGGRPRNRMNLPHPYYYENARYDSPIRSHTHPNAHSIVDNDGVFIGMADDNRSSFYPIQHSGRFAAINLREHSIIYLTREEVEELAQGFRNSSPTRPSPSRPSSSSSTLPNSSSPESSETSSTNSPPRKFKRLDQIGKN